MSSTTPKPVKEVRVGAVKPPSGATSPIRASFASTPPSRASTRMPRATGRPRRASAATTCWLSPRSPTRRTAPSSNSPTASRPSRTASSPSGHSNRAGRKPRLFLCRCHRFQLLSATPFRATKPRSALFPLETYRSRNRPALAALHQIPSASSYPASLF